MSIEYRIRIAREELGISQTEFSRRLEISPVEVSRIESGRRKTYTTELILKISEVLHVHIEWLFTGKGQKKILTPKQIEEFLTQRRDEAEKMTKEELVVQHEQTRAQLKKLEKQLKSILQKN